MISKRLVASYIIDWIVIIAIVAAGGGLNSVTPYMRPFSLLDLSISYPLVTEQISTATLVVVSLVAPAIIIFGIVAIFVPGPAFRRQLNRSDVIRYKLWEWEKGWAGLALSYVTAFFATQALKQMFGKPRPDMLQRCQPDLANIAAHVVGGYGQDISARWTLVSASICQQTDMSILKDGFRSFPSGHSSSSWSGLLYLSLFLCSKFAIAIPYLPTTPTTHSRALNVGTDAHELLPLHRGSRENGNAVKQADSEAADFAKSVPLRNQAASPPVYLIVLAFVPIAVAFYICSTRYVQFFHHGFDIICGALIGILAAYGSFRWYHLPISRGSGWAWGPRSRDRAFGIGVGVENYVGTEGWKSASVSNPPGQTSENV